jgi:hypothetical protein
MSNTHGADAPQGATHDRWVGDVAKNSKETLRVQLSTFRGYELVALRVWFQGEGDELRPSKSGFSLRVEKLPELRVVIDKAIAAARAEGHL